jgi:hypothetical protein
MAKLDPTRSADAWAAFRLASDEHSEKRHETIMKRKRDKLEFELFTKRQHVLVEHSMLEETARIGRYKRHIGEKQLDLDGRQSSPDGRYVAKDGRIVVTTPPEGRRVEQLWTTKEFPGNFLLKLEFRATPTADSGVFIRAPQLQCRDYLLAGPYKELKHFKPQEWNELIITVIDGKAMCRCNDDILEVALPVPESGPIGLEGDSGQLEYRRIRISKLP